MGPRRALVRRGTTPPPPDPETEPAAVPPPEGLTLPLPATRRPWRSESPPRRRPDGAAQVAAAAGAAPGDPDLGRHVVAAVADLPPATAGLRSRAGMGPPASTTKLLTAAAALHASAPTTASPPAWCSTAAASSAEWCWSAAATPTWPASRAAGRAGVPPARRRASPSPARRPQALPSRGASAVRLGYDDSLFTGPDGSPQWEPQLPPRRRRRADHARSGSTRAGRRPASAGSTTRR